MQYCFFCLVFILLYPAGECADLGTYKIYIYDWPSHIQSSWPETNTGLFLHGPMTRFQRGHEHYRPDMCGNFGFGIPVDAARGIFPTHSFCLYVMIMARLRVHPRRTLNRSEADLFIIPYDIGVSAQWNKRNGQYMMHQRDGCLPENDTVAELLNRELSQSQFYGHDHVLINSLFDLFIDSCWEVLFLCANCTVLSQEVHHVDTFINRYSRQVGRPIQRRWYAAPFASTFHWHENIEILPWEGDKSNPQHLVALWASPAVQTVIGRRLRNYLIEDCKGHPNQCVHVSIGSRSSAAIALPCSSTRDAHCIPGQSKAVSPTGLEAYNTSVFCFQPSGDLELRKGIIDSFLIGCIPVLFLKDILTHAYPWFFPPGSGKEASMTVYIHHNRHRESANFSYVEQLMAIPPDIIRQKQEAIRRYAPSLVYAVPPGDLEPFIGYNGLPGRNEGGGRWSPPFKDAVDMLLDSTFSQVDRYRRTGTVPEEERPSSKPAHSTFSDK